MNLQDLHRWPRQTDKKDHDLYGNEHFGTEAPCVIYETKPIIDPKTGNEVPQLTSAWITLNNPAQFNSYTTEMVKGVIAGMQKASADRGVVAVVFTAVGDKAFCTGGNTKEYSEYYSMNGTEYGYYMDLFNAMVDGILNCKKPVICRVNGMRVAGGQELGLACDLAISSDLAIFGQAGPRHGSAPVGGACDFLPEFMSAERAMWSCISCEMWSAYKMQNIGMISKAVKVLKVDGKFIANPMVITDKYLEDGEIVYGEMKTGAAAAEAKEIMKQATVDFTLLDQEVNKIIYTFMNLFPNCLMMSIDGCRAKKKFFWDQSKLPNRHWLVANMQSEAYLGFNAFNNKKATGKDQIDFVKYRQLLVDKAPYTTEFFEAVMAPPLEK
jgi:6-oxo-cyclohex-1-ene-carbonyl-CoA hydrolase